MATPLDSIRVGDWVGVSGHAFDDTEDDRQYFNWESARRHRQAWSGEPAKVLAISLPFIAVLRGGEREAIDTRYFSLTKLRPAYVRALTGAEFRAKPSKKKRTERNRCVRCGEPLRNKLVSRDDRRFWVSICQECGWQGDPVPIKE